MRVAFLAFCFFCPIASAQMPPIAEGPYEGDLESLRQYQCPEWFRNAKFGIWAHWGPQAVPMQGDWYAKHMYVQGHRQYVHHLDVYGHPSEHGYKEIISLWKAEKWDPDQLMALYKKAGARYFVSMGSHHDNFYLWNSKLHRWNSVAMGPHRDVVGEWQKAAQKYGLRFGVSEHLGASFTWFQPSHGSDQEGHKTGVPYDGADPNYQDLYHFPAEPGDTQWYSKNPRWQQQWFERIKELVDSYQPDLLYTDGGVPFGNAIGASMIAHFYNSDAARRGGKPDVVYTCKQRSEGRWIEDLERGVMPGINPDPWQTDTSIGDWYYNENWKFRPVSWNIHMLVDIVSKNGNLLLNVVQRPDGSLDPEVEGALEEMAEWIAIHGEAIYDTRPWLVYGEGTIRYKGGHFQEDYHYTARDIRFTAKGPALYAIALGWPDDGRLLVRSLASPAGKIKTVHLLGHDGKLDWKQTDEGLAVYVPDPPVSKYTCGLKITGEDLKPAPLPEIAVTISANSKGNFTLKPEDANLHGVQIQVEAQGGQPNIGFWDRADESVGWTI
ncbi:MAG: alpha-L-fucosidase, partial [Pirellulales bacterium]|nr:alpha-L-fucosidase [Pirellulales bacterium]